MKSSLDVLYYSGASQALRGFLGGKGAIFMLHHVRPGGGQQEGFAPNSGLEITPQFLDKVIGFVKARGYRLLTMDEAVGQLTSNSKHPATPFAVFTLDDAYRDNLQHAWPIFRRHDCPFTIYASPAITDGTCELWWRGLEAVIAGVDSLSGELNGESFDLPASSSAQKYALWDKLYWRLRTMDQFVQRDWIRRMCEKHKVDLLAMCKSEAMNWKELRQIAADPLCQVGAHTVNHMAMSRLSEELALREMVESADRLEQELGCRPVHFAYPYGDSCDAGARDFLLARRAGFASAVTTRKGLVYQSHQHHLMALPRLSLNGEYQRLRYVDVLMSGSAFALWNGFRQLNVA